MKQKYLVPPGTGSALSVDKSQSGETLSLVSFMVAVVQSPFRDQTGYKARMETYFV